MSFLELDRVGKQFGPQTVVDDFSLAVGKGEFVSFLGPSGCGKTTTLQMIAGFLDPSRGAIRLEGRDLTAVPPAKRGLGIVFQSYALFPHMTAAENVAFGLEMRRVPRAERDERVRATLAMVGLAGYENRYPRRMSGGQQQRVALARALVIRPSVLLLDEPLSNLDAKLREGMQIELRQIQRNLGTTTILVTHDQIEAMSLSDRIVVMSQGRIEQIGTPQETYERPASAFVSQFLGKTNDFAATVDRTVAPAPANAAPTADTRDARAAWVLTAPALMLFVGVLVIPLAMTVMLSFHDWGQYKGIEPVFILKNWHEIATDPYYAEMFWRTFRIALLTTLITAVFGAPEAYILNRMSGRWKSFFLLVILGPLLISVVARTLGWALLFGGNNGLVNTLLMSLGLIGSPLPFMFTEAGMVIALAHVMMPFMVLSVWTALQRLDPQLENAALTLGAGSFTIIRRIILPQIMPGVLSGAIIVFSLSASAFATPAIIGGRRLKVAATLAYDEFLNTLNWPLGAAVAILLLLALVLIVVGSNALIERRYAEVFR